MMNLRAELPHLEPTCLIGKTQGEKMTKNNLTRYLKVWSKDSVFTLDGKLEDVRELKTNLN